MYVWNRRCAHFRFLKISVYDLQLMTIYSVSYECPRLIKLIWNLKKMHRFHCVLVYYRHINDVFNICRFCLFCEYNFAMQMFLKIQLSTTINQSLRTPRRLVRDSIYEIWEIQYLNKPVKSWILKHVSYWHQTVLNKVIHSISNELSWLSKKSTKNRRSSLQYM